MKKFFTTCLLLLAIGAVMCQNVNLSFTAKRGNDNAYVRLSRVKASNETRNWQEILNYPDTTLILIVSSNVGIQNYNNADEVIIMPNPFNGQTEVNVVANQAGPMTIDIYDMSGKRVISTENFEVREAGQHAFQITLANPQVYVMHAVQNGHVATAKLVNTGNSRNSHNSIKYSIKYIGLANTQLSTKLVTNKTFAYGDQMRYVGYADFGGTEYASEAITRNQQASENFTLIFNNIPASVPGVTTATVTGISGTGATCGGEVTYDGNTTVTARGVCWSTSANPTIADNHTTDGTGIGSFVSNINGLNATTTYHVRAYATNASGTAYGEDRTFTTLAAGACPSTVSDYDRNSYPTVLIGTQCWMASHLRTTHFANGTAIAHGQRTVSEDTPYYYHPAGSSSNDATYGLLYNWAAASNNAAEGSDAVPSGLQGICPNGWHLPSLAEYQVLVDYLSNAETYGCGGDATKVAKAIASSSNWSGSSAECSVGNDQSSNNASGFNIQPAGITGEDEEIDWDSEWGDTYMVFEDSYLSTFAYLWTSTTTYYHPSCLYLGYSYTSPIINGWYWERDKAVSVRCVKD